MRVLSADKRKHINEYRKDNKVLKLQIAHLESNLWHAFWAPNRKISIFDYWYSNVRFFTGDLWIVVCRSMLTVYLCLIIDIRFAWYYERMPHGKKWAKPIVVTMPIKMASNLSSSEVDKARQAIEFLSSLQSGCFVPSQVEESSSSSTNSERAFFSGHVNYLSPLSFLEEAFFFRLELM